MKKSYILLVIFCMSPLVLYSEDMVHSLQEGETLYRLSKMYDIPLEVLIENNSIVDPSSLSQGEAIIIPDTTDDQVPSEEKNLATSNDAQLAKTQKKLHLVKKGETLYKVSRDYGVPLIEIKQENNLQTNTIYPDQHLMIPVLISNPIAVQTAAVQSDSQAPPKNSPQVKAINADSNPNQALAGAFNQIKASGKSWDFQVPVQGTGYRLSNSKLEGYFIESDGSQSVKALAEGQVLYVSKHSSFQNVILVQTSKGIIMVYGGQDSVTVKKGDFVKKGQTLGKLGVMPILNKHVLYFSAWIDSKLVDLESLRVAGIRE